MIIRLTAKLGKKIGSSPIDSCGPVIDPFLDWVGHLFTAQRTQYIILSNTASLYSIIMPGRGVSNEKKLVRQGMSSMEEFIVKDGFELIFRRLIAPYCGTIIFFKVTDKRVLGSIVEMVREAQFWFIERDLSPFEAASKINTTIFSYLRYNCPKEVFSQLKPGASPD